MTTDRQLVSERFPRSSQYHPDWVLASASGGANALWLTEWLTSEMDLRSGMKVLDLGCGASIVVNFSAAGVRSAGLGYRPLV